MKHGSLIAAILILFGGVGYFLFFSTPAAEAPSHSEPSAGVTVPDEVDGNDDTVPTPTEPVADTRDEPVTSFEECVAAGNPVMESYPRQCRHAGVLYVEEVVEPVVSPAPPIQLPTEPVACTMDAKICPDGSAVGRVGPDCEFAPCPDEEPVTDDDFIACTPESRLAEICAAIYEPVCALGKVECITAPCDPVEQTQPNACKACINERVIGYRPGVCYEF